jgi:ABC-2 type transport system ATP-binding protein
VNVIARADGLGRWYGQVVGLSDLTVQLEPGITGLVGPNGAGKSTFMKLLVGEIRPSRGTIEVLGEPPFANRGLYRRLGFCPQQDAFYDGMSGREFVRYLMRLAGFARGEADRRSVRALERLHLEEAMDRRLAGYSKGMRQRAKIAQSIAHDPELLVVDEPLTGLDPVARHQVLELFRELGRKGVHIILSSHVLHEVESLTSTIVLIHRGRLLAQGGVSEVRQLLSRHPRKVRIAARDARRLGEACLRLEHVDSVRIDTDGQPPRSTLWAVSSGLL